MGCSCSKGADDALHSGKAAAEHQAGEPVVERPRSLRRDGSDKRPSAKSVAPVICSSPISVRYSAVCPRP